MADFATSAQRYQILSVFLLNLFHLDAGVVACKDPGSVQKLTAVVDGSTHLSLSWEVPAGLSTACFAGYRVCLRQDPPAGQQDVCGVTQDTDWSSGDLQHVLPCTGYLATVAVLDLDGNSSSNASVNFRTGPGNVVNLTSERLSSKRVRLAWTAPASGFTCAVLYQLSYCVTSSYWQQDCNHTTLSLPVNTTQVSLQVEPCRYNHVSVTTIGDESNSSAEVLVISPRVNNPQPPTKLEVDVVNSTTFTLSWEDSQDDSTECRLGYRICVSAAGHEDYDCVFEPRHLTYPDTGSTWTNSHSPTTACTVYTASVSTVYDSLDLHGAASDAASIAFHTAPENVANLEVMHTNQTAISLEWSESQSVSECADHYTLSWCNVPYPWYDQCKPETHNLTTSEKSFNITGLSSCSYYWVMVSTVGEDGLASETKQLIITPPVAHEVRSLDVVYEHGSKFAASWDVVGGDACVSSYRVCWLASGAAKEDCDPSRLNNYESRYNLSLQTCSNYTLDVTALDVYNGTSDSVTAYFATGPDNVGDLNVSEVTNHTALVTWERSPSSCVDHYVLGWCATDYPDEPCNPTGTTVLNATAREYTITALEPCSYSVISIRTRTADNRSSDSREKIVETLLGEFGPSTHVSLTAFSARLFSLEYRPASNAAHCTAGYTGCFIETGTSGEPVCIRTSNLQYWSNYGNATRACTHYDVTLTSLSKDNRTWSTSMSFTSPPEEVVNLQVWNGTSGASGSSVRFTWRVSPDNGCMSHQRLNCSRVEVLGNDHAPTVLWSTGANLTNNVTEFEVGDLEPCAAYTVNVFQEPTPLDPIPTEILFHTASNVTSVTYLKVVGSDDSSVNISYLAPEASPRCVSKYSVCWRQKTADTDTCHTRRGSGVHDVSIQGLTNCTEYVLSVTPVAPNDEQYTVTTLTATTTGCRGTTSAPSTTTGTSTVFKASLAIQSGLLLSVLLLY